MDYKKLSKRIKLKLLRYGLVSASVLGLGLHNNKLKAQDTNSSDSINNEINSINPSDSIFVSKENDLALKFETDTTALIIQEKNLKKAQEAFDDIFIIIAYTEDFRRTRYHCGARWTIGYGNTVLDNHKRVTKYTKPINMERGKDLVYYHINEHVYPFLKHIDRELNREQLVAVCSFIYNTGGEFFTGHDKDGKPAFFKRSGKQRKASDFLTAINNGEDDYTCAQKMLQAHTSNNRVAWGLFKRRWVEIALYTGKLNAKNILDFKVKGLYLHNKIDKLYDFTAKDKNFINNRNINKEQRKASYVNFKPKLDDETVNWYIEFNMPQENEKTVASIVDKETVIQLNKRFYKEHYNHIFPKDFKIMPPVIQEIKVDPKKLPKIEIKPIDISKKNRKKSR